jgi:L-alanine-DL-glutamate epimerase-like enolase superfamily enzyme
MEITAVKPYPLVGGIFCKIETDAGLYGVGEAGIKSQTMGIAAVMEHLAPMLVGEDPMRTEHLWQKMFRGGFFPGGKILCSAISAIDIALWDIKAKAFDVPLYQLLGGKMRDKVVCYPHCGGRTIEELIASAKAKVAQGYKFVRFSVSAEENVLEPSRAVRRTIREFEALRTALGEDIEICLDIHTRLDPMDSVVLCRALEPYRPYFLEDPLRSENPDSFRLFRQQVASPIAIGEQFASKWEFRQVIEEELTNYARVDTCIVGGITETMKIAGWAETHYINLALHNPLGPVSTAACLHVDLAASNFGVQECPRIPGTTLTDVFPVQVEWEDGYLLRPERPGLGVEFDEEAAKEQPYRDTGGVRLFERLDGSLTNW